MLTSQEERVWEDIQQSWSEEPRRHAPSPANPASRAQEDLPAAIAVGVRITILLLLVGAAQAALALAVVTALGWALWHHWPLAGKARWSCRRTTAKTRTPADSPVERLT